MISILKKLKKEREKIQNKDIVIFVVSLVILASTHIIIGRPYYSLSLITGSLPTWIAEGLIAGFIIGIFKEKASWSFLLSWGFLIVACLQLALYLFELYTLSQLSSIF